MSARLEKPWEKARRLVKRNNSKIDPKAAISPSKPSSSTKNELIWISQPDSHKPRIHGFESRFLSLKKLVEDGRNDKAFKAFSVVGPRGIGKTALCQAYYYHSQGLLMPDDNNKKESQGMELMSFCPKVWISMPRIMMEKKNVNIIKILLVKAILENLGVEEERIKDMIAKVDGAKMKVEELLYYVLRLQLTGKRYLIVLDGVRSSICNFFDELEKSNGTVIMTSIEDKAVKEKGGRGNKYVVLPLFDAKSLWAIFEDNVDKLRCNNGLDMKALQTKLMEITSSGELKLLGKDSNAMKVLEEKIVTKCEGLPLTAVLLANTMPEQLVRVEKEIKDGLEKEKKSDAQKKKEKKSGDDAMIRSEAPIKTEGEKMDENNGKMKKDGSLKGKEKEVEGDSIVDMETKSKKADEKNDATKKDDFPKVKEKKDESESSVVTTKPEADKNANEEKDETKKDGSPKGEEKKVESESSVVTTKSEATLKSEDKNANEEKDEMKKDGSPKGEEKKVESESIVNAAKPEALEGIEGTKVDEKSGEVKKDSSIEGEEKKAEGESTTTTTTLDAPTKTEDRNVDEAKEVRAQKEGEEATTQEEEPKEESAKKEEEKATPQKEDGKEVEDETKKTNKQAATKEKEVEAQISDKEGKKEANNK